MHEIYRYSISNATQLNVLDTITTEYRIQRDAENVSLDSISKTKAKRELQALNQNAA